jgi:hypothetical protein
MEGLRLFEDFLKERDGSLYVSCGRLGLSYQGLINKLRGKTSFTLCELQQVVRLYGLSQADIVRFFFG